MIVRIALLFLASLAIAAPASASLLLRVMDEENARPLVQLELCDESVLEAKRSVDEAIGEPVLLLTLNEEGSEKLAAMTTEHVGRIMQIVIGTSVISEPVIREPIMGGQIQMTGSSNADIDSMVAAAGAPCTTEETIA